MVVFAGQGDPRRSMALLWRTPGSAEVRTGPGPKPALSVDEIVDAAIEVADRDGMAGLSMRAVGERFGRTAMALYTYVPNKSELLDLMYDRAHAELPTEYAPEPDWRATVTAWAGDLWAFYLRHPWVLQVSQARPVLGPNEYVVLETLLRILYRTGLRSQAVRRTVGTLFHFVRGIAQTVTEARHAKVATGMSDEDWWYARSALLAEVAPDFGERFPTVTRLESDRGFRLDDESVPYLEQEARETFDFGLTVLLDGIEAVVGAGGGPVPSVG
ncbi:TetR/AcrR family transcriptional regulator [Micromonospora sp. NBC_01699]|uniref:TetR/AcrR family transcriptional regulator n=1 Tax=Micromonospora sp. NBC_01699 TaxID=2975984 RepID=UPI002E2B5595|nr:TetR/AcrR family transcriptional regulator [Micromonospora sp. NBC_01699]